ncbi:hypothetical protein [Halonatronum saccharophilum]|uniref:hypothetical protein n=1 Tax=Halonatronum saccharophilum TaxID=150060 RepID=UPI0004884912|nr:hypothetical protein [Halonatronum saccharophilum]
MTGFRSCKICGGYLVEGENKDLCLDCQQFNNLVEVEVVVKGLVSLGNDVIENQIKTAQNILLQTICEGVEVIMVGDHFLHDLSKLDGEVVKIESKFSKEG